MDTICSCVPPVDTQVTSIALYCIAVVGLALSPGPTVTSVLLYSLYETSTRALGYILGVLSANMTFVIAAALVRASGFALPCLFKCLLPPLGALMLLLVGGRLILESLSREVADDRPQTTKSIYISNNPVAQGFIVHALNPNTFVFFTSIFLTLVPLNDHYVRNVVFLGIFAICTDALVLFTYWQLANRIASIMNRGTLKRFFPLFSAVILMLLAIWKFFQALPSLMTI